MTKNTLSREELIQWLIDSDHEYKSDMGFNEWFEAVLRQGFVGYNNLTDEDLRLEREERIANGEAEDQNEGC